jgi:hypothetical protein
MVIANIVGLPALPKLLGLKLRTGKALEPAINVGNFGNPTMLAMTRK